MLVGFSKVSSDIKWYCFVLVSVFLFFIVAFRVYVFDFINYFEYFININFFSLLIYKGLGFLPQVGEEEVYIFILLKLFWS